MENSRRLLVEGTRAMLTAERRPCSTLLVALMNALRAPYWKVITDRLYWWHAGEAQHPSSGRLWNDGVQPGMICSRSDHDLVLESLFFQFICSPDMSNSCRDLCWEKSSELKITHLNFMLFRMKMDRNTDDSLGREIRRDSPSVESNSQSCFMFLNFISQFLDTSTVMMLINHSLISHRWLVKLEMEQLVMSHHWN